MVHWYYFQEQTLIWPKSTAEMSNRTMGAQLSPLVSFSACLFKTIRFMEVTKYWYGDETEVVFVPDKGNKCNTIYFKKRWHIYCNINVIYIVFFLLKKTEIPNSCCSRVLFCLFFCASTTPFYLRQEQILSIDTGKRRIG